MRTAIIGLGRMGRRYVQIVRNLGLPIVGTHDANPATLREAAAGLALPPDCLFSDASALFGKARPECVIVATTAPTHCDYTCRAADAGARYVLCEKPMAVSLAECTRMIETCNRHGVALAINHQMRYMEQYTLPKRIVNSAEIGGLASVSVVAGNFGLAMNGTHYFEMFRFMTDEEVTHVTAWLAMDRLPNPRGAEFADRAGQIRMTTRRGKRFYMDAGPDQGHGLRVVYAGLHGQVAVDELAGTLEVSARKPEHRMLPTTQYGMPWDAHVERIAPADVIAPTQAVLLDLIGQGNFPNGHDGRLAVAALVAAHVSHESGNVPVAVEIERLPQARTFPWA
jgi:predicted dehydrogenase